MRTASFRIVLILIAASALGTIQASADTLGTVDLENHNNNFSDTGTIYGDGYPEGANTYTGIYSWSNEGSTGLGAQVPNWGFCTEIPQGAQNGWMDVIPLSESPLPPLYGLPMGATKADYIRELWGRDFDPSWTAGANVQMAEAFSVAIFEILYETDPAWNVNSGAGFHVGADVEQAATANIWLGQLNGNSAYFANNLVAVSNPDGQDYVVQVPEPATLLLLAAGASGALRKRKR